jgi:hypothetical protein
MLPGFGCAASPSDEAVLEIESMAPRTSISEPENPPTKGRRAPGAAKIS